MEKYYILKLLGGGTFGKVYKCKNKGTKEIVAIKMVPVDFIDTEQYRNFIVELHILSHHKCKYIVDFYNIYFERDILYYVLEYCNKGTLRNLINTLRENNDTLNEYKIWDYFLQLICGMKYLHDNNVVHRDLKTQNILINNETIKICDFNTAKILRKKTDATNTFVGSLYYLSPELVHNEYYTNKIDIWALGCILYEMLFLNYAFNYKGMGKIIISIGNIDYKKIPDKLLLIYSPRIVGYIDKLVCKNRPSIEELIDDKIIKIKMAQYGIYYEFRNDNIYPPQSTLYPKSSNEFKGIINNFYKEYSVDYTNSKHPCLYLDRNLIVNKMLLHSYKGKINLKKN